MIGWLKEWGVILLASVCFVGLIGLAAYEAAVEVEEEDLLMERIQLLEERIERVERWQERHWEAHWEDSP